jgi:hypothetical protein
MSSSESKKNKTKTASQLISDLSAIVTEKYSYSKKIDIAFD